MLSLFVVHLFLTGIPEISEPAYKNNFSTIDQAAADYDDQRMCLLCKQVCVFSAVACECSARDVSCIRHYHLLCRCGKIGQSDHQKKDKNPKATVNRRFLISWASINDLQRLRKEGKKLLLGEMASPPPEIKSPDILKIEQDTNKVKIKEEAMKVAEDISATDVEIVNDANMNMI